MKAWQQFFGTTGTVGTGLGRQRNKPKKDGTRVPSPLQIRNASYQLDLGLGQGQRHLLVLLPPVLLLRFVVVVAEIPGSSHKAFFQSVRSTHATVSRTAGVCAASS